MIEYMNIPVLVCVSLLGVGAFVMIVGSLLKKQWATDGKKTSPVSMENITFAGDKNLKNGVNYWL